MRDSQNCGICILSAFLALHLYAQPSYLDTNEENFIQIAYPSILLHVHLTQAYIERTNRFYPKTFDEVINKNNVWGDVAESSGWFQVKNDTLESYWLSLLGRNWRKADLISSQLLSKTNTSNIIAACSVLSYTNHNYPTVIEKALFQRDVFQIYYIYINCTNFAASLDKDAMSRRNSTISALRSLLKRLRLSEVDYDVLTNTFHHYIAQSIKCGIFEDDNAFDLSKNFLPLEQALCGQEWTEMRFPASENRHFSHYGGRSFVRVYARIPGWNSQRFYNYWDNVNQQFGGYVHLNPNVPSLPAKSQLMLVRTFAILMEDDSIVDSNIPEEVLVRAFASTNGIGIDRNSSDYRGTYYFDYKLNRYALLNDPCSLGLLRISDDDAIFYGFYQDVPDLIAANDAGVTSMRYNCINCHALIHYGSSTVFSLEHQRLRNITEDQFSGDLLQMDKNGKYTFGKLNKNLKLDK